MASKAENINLELVSKLARAYQAIKLLKQELRESKESWLLYMWSLIEEEIQGYEWRTNPEPFEIHGTHKGKPIVYKISITDVVCVVGEGRDKYIYLKQAIKNIEGELHKTNIITINRNNLTIEKLCKELDGLRFHLVQVSKSAAINLAFYHYNNLSYTLEDKFPNCKDVDKIKGGKAYIKNYRDRKRHFDDVISLQRLVSGYKEKIEKGI
jgi:hypothetical protein